MEFALLSLVVLHISTCALHIDGPELELLLSWFCFFAAFGGVESSIPRPYNHLAWQPRESAGPILASPSFRSFWDDVSSCSYWCWIFCKFFLLLCSHVYFFVFTACSFDLEQITQVYGFYDECLRKWVPLNCLLLRDFRVLLLSWTLL